MPFRPLTEIHSFGRRPLYRTTKFPFSAFYIIPFHESICSLFVRLIRVLAFGEGHSFHFIRAGLLCGLHPCKVHSWRPHNILWFHFHNGVYWIPLADLTYRHGMPLVGDEGHWNAIQCTVSRQMDKVPTWNRQSAISWSWKYFFQSEWN